MVKEMSQKIALKPKVVVLPSGEVVAKKPKKKTLSERAEQKMKDEIEIKKTKKLEKIIIERYYCYDRNSINQMLNSL